MAKHLTSEIHSLTSASRYGSLLACTRRNMFLETIAASVFVVLLSFYFIKIEAFERWYQISRSHESWEMDEFSCVVFASALVGTVVLIRQLYTIRRLLILADETEQMRVKESQILSRQERMAALGKLSGGMAHEINNALQPILGAW